jgi:hypothetical protein
MLDNNEKLEIIVPTCSYRMGVLDIGEYLHVIFTKCKSFRSKWEQAPSPKKMMGHLKI